MTNLPLGMIILVIASILVYFGLAQRLLDRMKLTDKAALALIGAMIVGSFIDIPLWRGNVQLTLNVGGGLVPLGLALYLLFSAGTTKEWVRALLGAVGSGAAIYLIGAVLMPGDPASIIIDPLYVYPIVAGLVAYLLGRSRRSAFIAATLGVLSMDIVQLIYLTTTGTAGTVHIGGAGAFDSIVVAGLLAILLAEIIGETRERLQGGPESRGRDPELLRNLRGVRLMDKKDLHSETERDKEREEKRTKNESRKGDEQQ